MPATAHKSAMQSTTVRLPRRLYEEARCVIEKGDTDAGSLNELLVHSLSEKLRRMKRRIIDQQFAGMKHDAHNRQESDTLAKQFETNDRDTFRSAERNKP